jgi:putative drug exporter of the RND superfamily
MLQRLSSIALRAPRRVVAVWALVLVVGFGAAGVLFSSLDADLDGSPGFESEQVGARLDELDPGGGEVMALVEGAPVDRAVLERLGALDGVEAVHTLPSDDGRATGVSVELAAAGDDRGDTLSEDDHDALVETVAGELRSIDAPRVLVGGELLLDEEVGDLAERDAQRAEAVSLPIALVVMAIVFGGVLAAGLPLAIALGGMTGTMVVLAGVASLTDVSLYALNVTLMLGMGLGIDYGLLMISRFREERAAGWGVPDAVHRTMATAGRTVVFSAGTVAVALAGLLVFTDPTIRSLALAGIGVVVACLGAALTLMPALLGRFGHRLRARTAASDHGAFARLAGLIQRRALPVVVLVGVGLVLLAAPFAGARFDDIGVKALPRSSETRQLAEAVDTRFPGVTAEPVEVLADAGPDDPAVADWLDRLGALPGVAGATVNDASAAGTTIVEVQPEGRTNGPVAQRVVNEVRDLDAPFPVAVGGDPAEIVDFRESVASRLPLAIGFMVVATFVLLFLMTGSVVVPIKAIVMNVLSLTATLGALVWVFQDGHFAGVLGFDAPGSLDLVMPVVIFVFAFGLSMDYEVFLLARIREAWEETGDSDRAVAVGLQRSGRIITSAALLMVIVFAGFAAGEMVALKQLGLGLALAVIVDATVVRSLLVPATMKLMGRWNWWAPAPLARLHRRIGLREAHPAVAVTP